MSYIKAEEVLPKNIIEMIQQYIDGENIYVPKKSDSHTGWGEKSGINRELKQRNSCIYRDWLCGEKVSVLAVRYHLSEKSIQRIIRTMKSSEPV